jgi:DNA-binding winged helix-turn-helix (wHTH) protein/TolB-like protein/tetratricopeptide (TPR) repeat protein
MSSQNGKNPATYEFDGYRVDVAKRLVFSANGQLLPLSAKAFETLLFLLENPGRVIERDEIMDAVWPNTAVEENNLTQHISSLRRLLGESKDDHRFIVTVSGRGYKFAADVISRERAQEKNKFAPEFDKIGPPSRRWLIVLTAGLAVSLLLLGFLYRYETSANNGSIRTIAVLPFKPLIPTERSEYYELGMADTLISKLGSSGEIVVRPLSSVHKFTGLDQDALSIGRGLGVDAVLEGYIQAVDGRIRVSVRLLNTRDGRQLWAEQFNDEFTDVFTIQEVISEKVAAAVEPELTAKGKLRLAKNGTTNSEAYRLYILGRYHTNRLTLPETEEGISYLKKAIELDPNYALAYASLAQAYRSQVLTSDLPPNEIFPKSKEAALKALAIDDTLAESNVMVGHISFWYDWNWGEAEHRAKRGLELEPNNAAACYLLFHVYSNLGRHEEAIQLARRARELDPLSLITNSTEANTLFYAGRYDEALEKATKTLKLEDNFWNAHLVVSMIYTEQGAYAMAITEADKAAQLSGGNSMALAVKGYALARSGDMSQARIVLEDLLKRSRDRHVPAANLALLYNGLGDKEEALRHLETGFEERNVQMVRLKTDPRWNNLRSEPRFVELIRKMRFE